MMRSLVFFSILTLAAGCGESTGGGGGSGGSEPREPVDVTVDTFNVALAGAFIPFEAARRPYIVDAIAASDADILCLQEVWDQSDKVAIRDGAAEAFPHSAFFEDDLDTPIEDATNQQGEVPPLPTTAPCAEEPLTSQMNTLVDCLRDNCSTIPDSEDGQTTSEACAAASCPEAALPLLFGDAAAQRCYACVTTQLPTETFGDMRSRCPTVVNQDLAFQGQNGVMILSRHPLENDNTEELVIPGTWNRRTILRATAELTNGAELDVYCNHLTPIFTGLFFPYTGQYGGWQEEQELQAEKLINYVTETSGDRAAVILGDLNAGHAFPEQDIVAEGEETLVLLESAYEPAYTAAYTPLCTFCSTNPVTNPGNDPDETSGWIDHILLDNLPSDSVVSTERVFDEDVVPVGPADDQMMVPLSDHFGMRSVITVP
jgi:endonuclease/exonuclease/phosphatase family metal-dependent hydrolase